MAIAFAGMHDTPARMVAKGVLRGVVPWARARAFFVWRLRRRRAYRLCPLMCSDLTLSHLVLAARIYHVC